MKMMNNSFGDFFLFVGAWISTMISLIFIEVPPISDIAAGFAILMTAGNMIIFWPKLRNRIKDIIRWVRYFFTKSH
jgi:hypothetical protein